MKSIPPFWVVGYLRSCGRSWYANGGSHGELEEVVLACLFPAHLQPFHLETFSA